MTSATEALHHSEAANRLRAIRAREVADYGQRALAGPPVERLMQDAVSTVHRVLEPDIVALLELDETSGDFLLRKAVGQPEETIGKSVIPGGRESQAGYTLESNRPVIVRDWDGESRFSKPRLLEQMGVRSGVTVPIRGRARTLGVLGVQSIEKRPFDGDDISFMQAIANALANAIERRDEEEQAHHRALHDALTGLPNRTLFTDRLGLALAEQERLDSSVAVLFLDVDHFKRINDSLGHHAGDELLQAIAPRLKVPLRPGDTVARFGGDEFGILLPDIDDVRAATRVAEDVAAVLAKPFMISGREHFVTASIGIAVGRAGQLPQALIRDADAAMYRAKERGRARYEIFDRVMRVRVAERLRVENELRSAIDRGELRVHYQPIVSLATGRLAGAEALVRWQHPRGGLIEPDQFISVAEESGLIISIGRWVLDQACRAAATWREIDPDAPPPRVSVNLSARQLSDPELVTTVRRLLAATGIDEASLSLELTENALLEEADPVFDTLRRLREMGLPLILDDFGTGYSSLGYLQRLPFEAIKLDRSFVRHLGEMGVEHAIVSAVVALARSLDLAVVAEGVESEEQLAIVRELGCHHAQGHHFSEAVPAEELGKLLEAQAFAYSP